MVLEEKNLKLSYSLIIDELKQALSKIHIDSSQGPDGFGSSFFLELWEILVKDLLDATKDFFGRIANQIFTLHYLLSPYPRMITLIVSRIETN